MKFEPDQILDCPNFGYPTRGTPGRKKPDGKTSYDVEGVCLHITGSDDWERTKNYLMRHGTNASYNYVIMADGKTIQLVNPDNAAYSHGGTTDPTWPLLKPNTNPNRYTCSIARTGSGRRWTYPQMAKTWIVIKYLAERYNFPVQWPHVFGHFEITTNRWYCPGVEFWGEIEQQLAFMNDNPVEDRKYIYRVFAGSFEHITNARNREHEVAKLSPVIEPQVVYNKFEGQKYFRVLAAEHYNLTRAHEAKAWFEDKGFGTFVVTKKIGTNVDLPFPGEEPEPKPEPKPEPELDVFRKLLRKLFELLKSYFDDL